MKTHLVFCWRCRLDVVILKCMRHFMPQASRLALVLSWFWTNCLPKNWKFSGVNDFWFFLKEKQQIQCSPSLLHGRLIGNLWKHKVTCMVLVWKEKLLLSVREINTNLVTCEADFYFSIPLAINFTDDPSCWSVLNFTRDAVKFPAIKRLGVKRDRSVVTCLSARDVYFAA